MVQVQFKIKVMIFTGFPEIHLSFDFEIKYVLI